MRFVISPKDKEQFGRLCFVGLGRADRTEFTIHEWYGQRDAKGRVMTAGVNPDIRQRLMAEHTVTVYQ